MTDMTVSEFLQQHFAGPEYSRLRHSIVRMVEGYDAADPALASILALPSPLRQEGRSAGASKRVAVMKPRGLKVRSVWLSRPSLFSPQRP